MQHTVALQVVAALSEKGFSLDELVLKTKELFEQQGLPGFVSLVLALVNEGLSLGLVQGCSPWKPKPCCAAPRYELYRSSRKTLRTSVGKVCLQWRRLRCCNCRKSCVPLREFLGLARYQPKTAELERVVAEVVSEQSYRRSSRHLGLIGEIPVPKSTAHRWVMESGCDGLAVEGVGVESLMADGTGYKRRPSKAKPSNRGEVRVVLGVRRDGGVVPFGAWSGSSWEAISQEIRQRSQKLEPLGQVLLSDGELGLAEALAGLAKGEQRCHWHLVRDLGYTMWKEEAPKSERDAMSERLAGVIGIELPEEDFERVSEKDRTALEERTRQAERGLEELIGELVRKGYERAADYVRHAQQRVFSYVRLWLASGLVCGRTISMLERLMRELGRRLKKIAFGWSESGAAKMARIILKRITSAGGWDDYWKRRLRLDGNVMLVFQGAKVL